MVGATSIATAPRTRARELEREIGARQHEIASPPHEIAARRARELEREIEGDERRRREQEGSQPLLPSRRGEHEGSQPLLPSRRREQEGSQPLLPSRRREHEGSQPVPPPPHAACTAGDDRWYLNPSADFADDDDDDYSGDDFGDRRIQIGARQHEIASPPHEIAARRVQRLASALGAHPEALPEEYRNAQCAQKRAAGLRAVLSARREWREWRESRRESRAGEEHILLGMGEGAGMSAAREWREWRERRLVSGAAAWSWARDGPRDGVGDGSQDGGDGSRDGTHGARDGATPDTSARLLFGRVGMHHPRLEARACPGGGYETPSIRAVSRAAISTEHR